MTRFAPTPTVAALAAIAMAAVWLLAAPVKALAQQPAGQGASAKPQAGVERRLDRIEEQLLDLNSMIGTLQTLAGNASASAPPAQQTGEAAMVPPQAATSGAGPVPGEVDQRIQALETQIGALSSQMERVAGQLSEIRAALAGSGQLQPPGDAQQPAPEQPLPQQQGQLPSTAPETTPAAGQQPTFGSLSVQPEQPAPQTQQPVQPVQPAAPAQQPPQATAAAAPPDAPRQPSAESQAAYDAAFRRLVQRDFAGAEEGFRVFLQTYPNDPLAGNAQYWLGETHYVRGQFREAANSFLTGYRKYRNSDKAPANLLKLGMSLSQLGQKDDACATFSELANKFPNAPSHLKQRAASERERTGC